MFNIFKYQFAYFYRKSFNKRYELSDKDNKYIENFLSSLQKEYQDGIGEEWLFEYLSFQFNKYSEAETKMNVQLHWIYGKKALEKWKNRNLEHYQYFNDLFRKRYNIKRVDIISLDKHLLSKDYKSKERNRFLDRNRKLLHCRELLLYDENSADCMICKNKKYCETKNK